MLGDSQLPEHKRFLNSSIKTMADRTESMIRDTIRDEIRRDNRASNSSIDAQSTLKSAHENAVNSMLVLMAMASLVGIIAALSFDRNPNTPAVQSSAVQTSLDLPRDPVSSAPQNTVPQNTVLQRPVPQAQPASTTFYPAAPVSPVAPAQP